MRIIAFLMALLGSLPVSVWAAEEPETIHLIVAGSQQPAPRHSAVDIQIYDITTIGKTARALSVQLSKRQRVAEQQARLRIEKNLGAIRDELRREADLQDLIERFGITQFPAAVVNNSWLIYGVTDVDQIVARWRAIAW